MLKALKGREIYGDADLVIKVLPNNLSLSRVAVVIPKRVLAKAVKRNRLKRQLLAVIKSAKIAPGFDVVVLVRRVG